MVHFPFYTLPLERILLSNDVGWFIRDAFPVPPATLVNRALRPQPDLLVRVVQRVLDAYFLPTVRV